MVRNAAAVIAILVAATGNVASGADIVLLDFWSPQCGPCMQMKPLIEAHIQAKYPIRQIDTSRDMQTARQYNVTRWPCFIMLVDGQEVERREGLMTSEQLQQMFEKAKQVYAERHASPKAESPGTVRLKDDPLVSGPSATSAGPAPARDSWPQAPATVGGHGGSPPHSPSMPPLPSPGSNGSANDFPPTLLAATVRIRVQDSQGRSFGTGTIIDSRQGEALVVTCGHLFRESKGQGPMTVELFNADASGVRVAGTVAGQLISYDLDRDVAFVSIRPNGPVNVAPVAPARTRIERGDRVATIGCSNGNDPTLLPQRINQLDRYQGPPNIEVSGAPEEGRSGGGLFNLQGQLIGVCYAADYEGKEGLYAALDSIHEELNRLNLQDVYSKNAVASPLASQPPVVVRGQEPSPLEPVTPVGGGNGPAANTTASVGQLSPSEQAAFGEIMEQAATSEVVVIVRPKTPGGQSEVITLDNVSAEFVRALAERRRAAGTVAK